MTAWTVPSASALPQARRRRLPSAKRAWSHGHCADAQLVHYIRDTRPRKPQPLARRGGPTGPAPRRVANDPPRATRRGDYYYYDDDDDALLRTDPKPSSASCSADACVCVATALASSPRARRCSARRPASASVAGARRAELAARLRELQHAAGLARRARAQQQQRRHVEAELVHGARARDGDGVIRGEHKLGDDIIGAKGEIAEAHQLAPTRSSALNPSARRLRALRTPRALSCTGVSFAARMPLACTLLASKKAKSKAASSMPSVSSIESPEVWTSATRCRRVVARARARPMRRFRTARPTCRRRRRRRRRVG